MLNYIIIQINIMYNNMKDYKQFNEEVYQPNIDNTTTPPGIDNDEAFLGKMIMLLTRAKDQLSQGEFDELSQSVVEYIDELGEQ